MTSEDDFFIHICVMIKFINWAAKGGPVFGPVMLEIRVSQTLAHPWRPGGSQSGREKMRDKSFRTISKNSSGCRLLIGHKNCFVLLCPIEEQFLLSSFREFVHDGYCLATLARFVHQACACKGNFYFLLS